MWVTSEFLSGLADRRELFKSQVIEEFSPERWRLTTIDGDRHQGGQPAGRICVKGNVRGNSSRGAVATYPRAHC
jgi:hypothetical protein